MFNALHTAVSLTTASTGALGALAAEPHAATSASPQLTMTMTTGRPTAIGAARRPESTGRGRMPDSRLESAGPRRDGTPAKGAVLHWGPGADPRSRSCQTGWRNPLRSGSANDIGTQVPHNMTPYIVQSP